MEILDGTKTSKKILEKLSTEVAELKRQNIIPKLVVILVGEDPASLAYVGRKEKACAKVGMESERINYGTDVTTEELIAKIEELNGDDSVHGILVQLPLPKQVYVPEVIKAIAPKKDVDGFTAYNIGKMFLSTEFEDLAPCTPLGVVRLLEEYGVEIEGKEAVVVGHSNIVGKPLAMMLLNRNATVTVCHVYTKDLADHTKRADILCVGVGKANLITADMVKEGAVVVDIGINRMEDGSLRGDVDFENVSEKTSYITPVPGGAGPMTVACLIGNTIAAAKRLSINQF